MTSYLGKSCSFCLPRVPFVNCRQFMYLVISLLVFECRIWDLIVLVPDHCLSFYFILHNPPIRWAPLINLAYSQRHYFTALQISYVSRYLSLWSSSLLRHKRGSTLFKTNIFISWLTNCLCLLPTHSKAGREPKMPWSHAKSPTHSLFSINNKDIASKGTSDTYLYSKHTSKLPKSRKQNGTWKNYTLH